jgi:hypothetical protein
MSNLRRRAAAGDQTTLLPYVQIAIKTDTGKSGNYKSEKNGKERGRSKGWRRNGRQLVTIWWRFGFALRRMRRAIPAQRNGNNYWLNRRLKRRTAFKSRVYLFT